jgi:hypothetical protein
LVTVVVVVSVVVRLLVFHFVLYFGTVFVMVTVVAGTVFVVVTVVVTIGADEGVLAAAPHPLTVSAPATMLIMISLRALRGRFQFFTPLLSADLRGFLSRRGS